MNAAAHVRDARMLAALAAPNFTLVSAQVDAQLAKVSPALWTIVCAAGIGMGTAFAFCGAKLIRTAGFIFGAVTGALLVAMALSTTTLDGDVWIGLVLAGALLVGLLASCILRLGRLTLVVALGFTVAAVIMQYGLSYFAHFPAWVEWIIVGVCVVIAAVFAWRLFDLAMIVASAAVGGFAVLLGIAYFVHGPLSPVGFWFNPVFLVSCTTWQCWCVNFLVACAGRYEACKV